ncbi:hypothetical protein SKAU_G00054250 [Synaphobranchus kaupii]|uniref:Uncharacterized protein n=1 Tax=Synaphobranchus kaupii TaxID=118154 RepID=A0A9Q1G3R5_SYNKA|nr:hypothetical protein SKAU_G00054250 [Synaphobranchus kaupii]
MPSKPGVARKCHCPSSASGPGGPRARARESPEGALIVRLEGLPPHGGHAKQSYAQGRSARDAGVGDRRRASALPLRLILIHVATSGVTSPPSVPHNGTQSYPKN